MSVSADRQTAARLLLRVEGGAYANRLLASSAAAGVRARVLGVLRWQRLLDAALQPGCRRPLAKLDPEIRAVLRIGLFEASKMGVPAAVATDGAVRLSRRLGKTSAAGLVNAVLRRAVPAVDEVLGGAAPDLELSFPEWLYRRWCDRFGPQAARQAMSAAQQPADAWAWFRDLSGRARLDAAGVELLAHPWCPGAVTAPGAARALLAEVERGAAYVQDPSSQLVAHLAAGLAGENAGFADLCAAPGGKTALLLHLRRWRNAVSLDLRPTRARLVHSLTRGVEPVVVATADATLPPLRQQSWDLVLLDAPCTGTGTLRRRPELKWRLAPADILEMAALQRRLLASACELVAPGGALIYATCSIEPEENEELFRDPPGGLVPASLDAVVPDGTPVVSTTSGGLRVLPGEEGDGFTIHALGRCP